VHHLSLHVWGRGRGEGGEEGEEGRAVWGSSFGRRRGEVGEEGGVMGGFFGGGAKESLPRSSFPWSFLCLSWSLPRSSFLPFGLPPSYLLLQVRDFLKVLVHPSVLLPPPLAPLLPPPFLPLESLPPSVSAAVLPPCPVPSRPSVPLSSVLMFLYSSVPTPPISTPLDEG
jgi:hypothetical protein